MTIDLRARLGRGLAALGLVPLLALAACGDDPQSGSLTVSYRFAPGVSCDQDQELVQEILVNVGADGIKGSESAPCENGGGDVVLTGIAAGNYDLFVLGIDNDDDAVLDNLGGQVADDRVEIIGGGDKTVDVTLGLAPARLEVALVVNNSGFPAQCSSNEIMIKGVRADAYDFGASDLLLSHDFDLCDFDGFEPVPDPGRDINGRRFDGVVIQPLNAAGGSVGSSINLQFAGPVGAGKRAQISVVCEADSCEVQLLGGQVGTTTADPTDDPSGSGGPATSSNGTGGSDTGADTTG